MGVKIECTDVKGKCKTQLHGIGPLGPPPFNPRNSTPKTLLWLGQQRKRPFETTLVNKLVGWLGGLGVFFDMDVGVLEYGCWRVGFLSPVIHPPTPPTLKCARFTLLQASQQAFPQPFYSQILQKGFCKLSDLVGKYAIKPGSTFPLAM